MKYQYETILMFAVIVGGIYVTNELFIEEVEATYIGVPQSGTFRIVSTGCPDEFCINDNMPEVTAITTYDTLYLDYGVGLNVTTYVNDIDGTNHILFEINEAYFESDGGSKSGTLFDVEDQVWTVFNFTSTEFDVIPTCVATRTDGYSVNPRNVDNLVFRNVTTFGFHILQESQTNNDIDINWVCVRTTD